VTDAEITYDQIIDALKTAGVDTTGHRFEHTGPDVGTMVLGPFVDPRGAVRIGPGNWRTGTFDLGDMTVTHRTDVNPDRTVRTLDDLVAAARTGPTDPHRHTLPPDHPVSQIVGYAACRDWRAVARHLDRLYRDDPDTLDDITDLASKLHAVVRAVAARTATEATCPQDATVDLLWIPWNDDRLWWSPPTGGGPDTVLTGHAPPSIVPGTPNVTSELTVLCEQWLSDLVGDGVDLAPGLYRCRFGGAVGGICAVEPAGTAQRLRVTMDKSSYAS
jgi:hypothetical protein